MANQKITDLNKLLTLSKDDLFIVVDRDSKSNSSSPTGETKGISAESLALQLNEIAAGETGINFKNLKDVPDSYEGFQNGYIKINSKADGIEFTDSPGSSEKYYNYSEFEQYDSNNDIIKYHEGDVLLINSNMKFQKGSASNVDTSEVIGIIRRIKYDSIDSQQIIGINIVFNGLIEFEYPETTDVGFIRIEKISTNPLDEKLSVVYENQLLIPGKTYFLGNDGTLCDFDPTQEIGFDNYVSKPMLVATTQTSGVVMNFRGLVGSDEEQSNKFIIPNYTSCNSIKTGDVLRIKRKHIRTSINGNQSEFSNTLLEESVKPEFLGRETGTTDYALCNSASQHLTEVTDTNPNPPIEDDSYGCDMIGIVTQSTLDYFEVQTSGMVEFNLPSYTTMTTNQLGEVEKTTNVLPTLFLPGYTYYIESFAINSDSNAESNSPSQLRNTIYDYTPDELGEFFSGVDSSLSNTIKPIASGEVPFRNTTIVNPFERDSTTGKVLSYSKPAFYAVSPTKILILNQAVYPNIKDRCNVIDPTLGTPCGYNKDESRTFTITRSQQFQTNSDVEIFSSNFLNTSWKTAGTYDLAVLNFVFETTQSGEQNTVFKSYELRKTTDNPNSSWFIVREL